MKNKLIDFPTQRPLLTTLDEIRDAELGGKLLDIMIVWSDTVDDEKLIRNYWHGAKGMTCSTFLGLLSYAEMIVKDYIRDNS